jgi:hypothetical protein
MGLFSRQKCPIHNTSYSVGTNGLEDYYYCKMCQAKLRKERKEKEDMQQQIDNLNKKFSQLEKS